MFDQTMSTPRVGALFPKQRLMSDFPVVDVVTAVLLLLVGFHTTTTAVTEQSH